MSYYPLLQAPGCVGWVTLSNFPPNDWESVRSVRRFANVSWADGKVWRHKTLSEIEPDSLQRFSTPELSGFVPEGVTAFMSLTERRLPDKTATLPSAEESTTNYPFWRATLGLRSKVGTETAYQGEVDPFPAPGSLLTFGHFLQCHQDVHNSLLLVNLEMLPARREGEIEIRRAEAPRDLLCGARVANNAVTCVSLDGYGLTNDDLPLILCRGLSGIPLYLSSTHDGEFMSLEHTHPPASAVVHGKRWLAHKHLKQIWFDRATE